MKKVKIKKDPKKGRGVYASQIIRAGDIIEICQLLIVPKDEPGDYLSQYVFGYDRSHVAVALGNGSLYNHSERPNVTCYFDFKKKILIFEALVTIKPSKELLINYGYTQEEKERYKIS